VKLGVWQNAQPVETNSVLPRSREAWLPGPVVVSV